MSRPDEVDLANAANRTVTEATAIPPDDLGDDHRAYLAWLRDPNRPARRPKPRRLHVVPDPAPNRRPLQPRDPAYHAAAETLRQLPDLGAASLQAAREVLGGDAPLERLVIHAAAHPVTPEQPGTERNSPERAGATAPACAACGTALDPDGTCHTCTNGAPQ